MNIIILVFSATVLDYVYTSIFAILIKHMLSIMEAHGWSTICTCHCSFFHY